MTLWFVGTGISGPRSAPAEARRVLAGADVTYVEQFTSPAGGPDLGGIAEMAGGEVREARRWLVEDGAEILEAARGGEVALVSYGDPYVATTHAELRTRAARAGIRTGTVHASSAVASAVGECGLHHYKVGRMATVMSDPASAATPYAAALSNMAEGLHTVLLLEYDQDRGFFLGPGEALGLLEAAEAGQRRGAFLPSTYAVVASRIGLDGQAVAAGRVSSLRGADFGPPPHALLVPGRLHFTESDALRALARCLDEPAGNEVRPVPAQMVAKYVPMVRQAIREAGPRCRGDPGRERVLEGAELYARDAESFLERGLGEVAVLCAGYADGLVDALRIADGLERAGGPSQ